MPFTKGTVPDRLKGKGIPQKYIDIFIEVFNSVYDRTKGDEGAAYRQAHGVMNKNLRKDGYRQGKDGMWHKYKKGKESEEPEFLDYSLSKLVPESVVEEGQTEETADQRMERHLRDGMRFVAVALRDDTISQQGTGFERWYSKAFNDLCLENTLSWMGMGGTPTIYNRHDSAGGSLFSGSTENPIGKIEKLWREGEEIRYQGFISPTDKGKEVIRLVHDGVMQPTSVRIYEWADRYEEWDHDDQKMSLQVMEDGRIGGSDFCEQPGIPGAGLVQVLEHVSQEEDVMPEEEMTAEKLQALYPQLIQELCAQPMAKVAELEAMVAEQTTEAQAVLAKVEEVSAQNLVLQSALKRLQLAAPPAVLAVAQALEGIPEDTWPTELPRLRVKAALEVLGAAENKAVVEGVATPKEQGPDVGDPRPTKPPQGFEGLSGELEKMARFLRQ